MPLAQRVVRSPWVALAAILIGSSFAGCNCGGPAGSLAIVQPVAHATFNLADDLVADSPGVQLEATVTAKGLDGATVSLKLPGNGGASPTGVVAKGVAKITYTLGASGALVATAKDSSGKTVTSPAVSVTFDGSPQACRFVTPADGAVLGASQDASPAAGFQVDVQVRCAGVELGNLVALTVDGASWGTAPLGPGGLASFAAAELAEGANQLEADTRTNAGVAVKATARVTVKTGACRILLAPPTGSVFNARGESQSGRAIADLEPGEPMNAELTVTTAAACAGADLVVKSGTGVLATTTVTSPTMTVPVELPDGTDLVRAYLSGKAKGTSPLVTYTVDAVVPVATLTYPAGGESFTDADDKSDQAGLQVPVRGSFTGIDAGQPFEVVLDGVSQPFLVGEGGSFDVLVTLADGDHTLFVRATRPSGTVAQSAPVTFHSSFLNGSLSMVSPTDGELFPLARDADPTTDGYQIAFTLAAPNLAGATGQVQCGAASGTFTVGADGTATSTVTVPDLGCAGATLSCLASLTTAGGTAFKTAKVHLVVDAVPPQVRLLTPTPDSVLSSNVVAVTATTDCPGETQTALVLRGGMDLLAGPQAVTANAVDFSEVTLPAGDSALDLQVSDAAGNVTDTTFHVTVDTETPQPFFLDPPASGAWAFGPSDDEDSDLSNGFQHALTVALDNKPVGTSVVLSVGTHQLVAVATVAAATSGHKVALFDRVTLPEGTTTVRACAKDVAGSLGCTPDQKVTVTTGRPTCAIVQPADAAVIGPAADLDASTPGIQADVRVETNAPAASLAHLVVQEGAQPAPAPLDATVAAGSPDNAATFGAVTFPEEGSYTLVATCTAADGTVGTSLPTSVRVALSAPAISLDSPPDGTSFNLASADQSVDPGFQIKVEVSTQAPAGEADGDVVSLTVDCGQGPQTYAAPMSANAATFQSVTLPDQGACLLTAQLQDLAGNESAPVTSHVQVDRVPPTVAFDAPTAGSLLGKLRDADPSTPGFQLDQVTVKVDGASASEAPTLAVGTNSIGPGTVTVNGSAEVVSWLLVPLQEGDNTLTVTAVDDAGNQTVASETVTVDTVGPVVSIQSLFNNQTLSMKNDTDPATAGLQVNVGLSGQGLVTGTTVYICSPQADPGLPQGPCGAGARVLASAILEGGSAVVNHVTLPEGTVSLYAVATDLALNASPPSDTVTVNVDSVPPEVTSLQVEQLSGSTATPLDTQNGTAVFGPAQDSGTAAGFQTRLVATLTGIEAGKNLTATFMDTNPGPGTVLGTVAIAADGTATLDTTLLDGGHRINVVAHDLAGNPVSTPESPNPNDPPKLLNFGVDLTAPALTIVAPVAGKLLAKDDLDPSTPGLQSNVVVDSDAGAGRAVSLFLDGSATALATAPLPTTGQAVSIPVTFPEGSHTLTASVTDSAGNNSTTAGVALVVDSVAPVVAVTSPSANATLTTDDDLATPGFQISVTVSYGQVEAGQPLTLSSSTGGQLARLSTDASGQAQATVTVPAGQQTLTATTVDVSGNQTSSAGVTVTVQTGAPSIHFDSTADPMYFGVADGTTADGGSCQVTIPATCDTDGATAVLVVDGTAGTPIAVANNAVSFSLTLANGASAQLQLQATGGNGHVGYSAVRQAVCDLSKPTVALTVSAWVEPGATKVGGARVTGVAAAQPASSVMAALDRRTR